MFNTDNPISQLKDDALDRSSFSRSLGDAILQYENSSSIAIGLFGGWGTGKTSVINMVLDHIQECTNNLDSNKKPIIIKFSPWNYSDQNQLILQFFNNLSVSLKHKNYSKIVKKAGEKIELYSNILTPLKYVPVVGQYAETAKSGISWFGKVLKKVGGNSQENVTALKNELDDLLGKLSQKIIVVIDDIDRLNDNEIRQIFQLVKSLCDFKNTIYLLSFDKNVVVGALSRMQEGKGDEYLEKVIQVPFELPLASKKYIEELLFKKLDVVIKEIPENKWDKVYWGNIYHSGIKYFFNSLRDVNRFINTFSFGYGLIKNEVNPIDFIAITAIQIFLPDVYYMIRDNKSSLCNSSYSIDSTTSSIIKERNKTIIDGIINNSASDSFNQELLKKLLIWIFPYLNSIYSNYSYSSSFYSVWRSENKICSPDIFDVYFHLSLSKDEISQVEIDDFIIKSNDSIFIHDYFVRLVEKNTISRFLERLEDHTSKNIPLENIQTIIDVITNIGDLFINDDEGSHLYSLSNDMRILRVIHQLIVRYDNKTDRFNILKNAFSSATESLYTIVHTVIVYCQEQGKYGLNSKPSSVESYTLEQNHLEFLEDLARSKIDEWAENGSLIKHKKLVSILFSWKHWDKDKKLVRFINSIVSNINSVVLFISLFLYKSSSHGLGDYVASEQKLLNYKGFTDFIDTSVVEPSLRALYNSSDFSLIPESSKIAISQFLEYYDGKRTIESF